ncbi:hypothetical protein BD413DRAFT_601342 [Trametes elegans]|nr:hypothetical protein BD413DRAFT_601342 [Trametes elegans]
MFELVQVGLRFLLIGAASVVLALSGYIISIVVGLRRAYARWRAIQAGTDHEPSSPLIRDRGHHDPSPRPRPQPRRRSTNVSRSLEDTSPRASSSGKFTRSPLRSSPEPMHPSEERHESASLPRRRRHRRRLSTMQADDGLPSIDAAMEEVEATSSSQSPPPPPVRPPLDVRGGTTSNGKEPARARSSPAPRASDSSPAQSQSSEPSIASVSAEEKARAERSPSPSSRVLRRLREHHNHLRDRCLIRVHSMPNPKSSKPTQRTDPYQAPYYFPTPLSPDADTYVAQVRNERRASARLTTDPITFRQYWEPVQLPSPRTSPKSKEKALPPSAPDIVVSEPSGQPLPSAQEGEAETSRRPPREGDHREGHHRWSWHLPHLHAKTPSHTIEEEEREGGSEKHSSTKFLFGHHRRRNGVASEDLKTKRTSPPPTA